jgi:hypothetical protein
MWNSELMAEEDDSKDAAQNLCESQVISEEYSPEKKQNLAESIAMQMGAFKLSSSQKEEEKEKNSSFER